jgi:hypothetical protein
MGNYYYGHTQKTAERLARPAVVKFIHSPSVNSTAPRLHPPSEKRHR